MSYGLPSDYVSRQWLTPRCAGALDVIDNCPNLWSCESQTYLQGTISQPVVGQKGESGKMSAVTPDSAFTGLYLHYSPIVLDLAPGGQPP